MHVSQETEIDRPVDEVRRQFGDVAHHERTAVHRGVDFRVIEEAGDGCRYEQITRLGPIRARQEMVLERGDDGALVNRITAGQFTGGTITFRVREIEGGARVHAEFDAPLRGMERLAAPLLATTVRRSLRRALAEDKADLESGRYASG